MVTPTFDIGDSSRVRSIRTARTARVSGELARYRLDVVAASAADAVRSAGGWLYDRSMAGWEVTGLDASGRSLGTMTWSDRSLVVIGSERAGLGPWETLCTRIAAIPMRGDAESLNAAVAGSIALYEACKQAFS